MSSADSVFYGNRARFGCDPGSESRKKAGASAESIIVRDVLEKCDVAAVEDRREFGDT